MSRSRSSSISTVSSLTTSTSSCSSSSSSLYSLLSSTSPPLRPLTLTEGTPESDILLWLEDLESRFVALALAPEEYVIAALCFLNGVIKEVMEGWKEGWEEFKRVLLEICGQVKAAPTSAYASLRNRFTRAVDFHSEKITQFHGHAKSTIDYANEKLTPALTTFSQTFNEKVAVVNTNLHSANEKFQENIRVANTNIQNTADKVQTFRETHPKAINNAAIGLVVVGSGILIPVAGVAALGAVGFGVEGVVAGSLAASAQSAIYGATTAGIFSALQSAGATAVGASVPAVVAGTTAMAAGLGGFFVGKASRTAVRE